MVLTALAWWHKIGAGTFDEYLTYLGRKTGGPGLGHFETGKRAYMKSVDTTPDEIAAAILENETKRYK